MITVVRRIDFEVGNSFSTPGFLPLIHSWRRGAGDEPAAVIEMLASGKKDAWPPDRTGQAMLDQERPEAIGPFIQVGPD